MIIFMHPGSVFFVLRSAHLSNQLRLITTTNTTKHNISVQRPKFKFSDVLKNRKFNFGLLWILPVIENLSPFHIAGHIYPDD